MFGIGTCYGGRITRGALNLVLREHAPAATVTYTRDNTYVNGEKLARDSAGYTLGGPRCDWADIGDTARRVYTIEGIREQPGVVGEYVKERGADAWQALFRESAATREHVR